MAKKLYRNKEDGVIGGVATGIADYFGIDPILVRIAFVALALANGAGILVYILLWLFVPAQDTGYTPQP